MEGTIERIREMLANLAQLTTEQLDELRTMIVTAADELDAEPTTAETVALIGELADAGDAVMEHAQALEAEAQANEEARSAAKERLHRLNGKDDETEDPEAVEEEEDKGSVETADETGAPAEPAVVASDKPSGAIRRMARTTGTPKSSPEADAPQVKAALVASGAGGAFREGDKISDRYELADGMCKLLRKLRRDGKSTGEVIVASAEYQYPEERRLESGWEAEISTRDSKLMDAVTHPMALVATGGICAPVNVDWSLGTWAVADRPIRDGLPSFQATRGGLTYRTPPNFADLLAATSVWSEATDASPGGATKPVVQIACPSPETVYVDAVPTRIGFGNMQSRFDPETVAANTDLAIVAAAKVAEQNLLTKIATACTGPITTAAYLGASRDVVANIDRFMAMYRDVNRLSDSQVVTVIAPRWLKDLMRADRAMEIAHDGSSVDPLAIPDAYIESLLRLRNIHAIWALDGLASNAVAGTYPNQYYAAVTGAGGLAEFPAEVMLYAFMEGSIQFLDAGRLDLGVVRDSTLDATNDYETFVETFEGIANRGFAHSAMTLQLDILPNGASAGTVSPTSD